MADMLGTHELLSIGRFARVSGLTVKALRHYDDIRLLRPAHVDDSTGYRYYALAQAREAEAIRRLRSLDVPLEDVAELLHADAAHVRERLAVHRARLEGRAVETKRILAELDRLIDGKEELVPDATRTEIELEVKEVAARRVAFVRNRVPQDEMTKVVPRDIEKVAHAIAMRHAGPPFCKCGMPDAEGYFTTEIGWPVPDDVDAGSPVEVATYPATRALVAKHVGPYEELGRSYRVMAEAMEKHGLVSAGDPVEWYESDPQAVPDPKDYVTMIEWPIGSEGDLKV
jgi:DNA-binding transcriptional MerR regulator